MDFHSIQMKRETGCLSPLLNKGIKTMKMEIKQIQKLNEKWRDRYVVKIKIIFIPTPALWIM